jgi:phosphatidylglycerophosphatase GEP4
VSHHLAVPVLRHGALKPAHACAAGVRTYFAARPTPVHARELLVVGDRVFTDVVLARRLGALGVWTTGVWARESTLMRAGEAALVRLVRRLARRDPALAADAERVQAFVRAPPAQASTARPVRRWAWLAWPRRVSG